MNYNTIIDPEHPENWIKYYKDKMDKQSIKEWAETCYCPGDCNSCVKSLEKCRQDLYKIVRSLLTRTKLPPEEKPEIYT